MNDKIYQKQTNLYGYMDTIYFFFYNMEDEELLDYDEKAKAQIMVEYNCRTYNVSFYITRTREPIIEREEFLIVYIEDIIDERISIPDKIREALMEIRKYIEGE